MKILIDRNIEHHAFRATGVRYKKAVSWGNRTQIIEMIGKIGLTLPKQKWLAEQIKALPTISRLAKEKKITLFTSNELQFEGMYGADGLRDSNYLFHDIDIQWAKSPVDRSFFESSIDFDKSFGGNAHDKWYSTFLMNLTEKQAVKLIEIYEKYQHLPGSTKSSLLNISRFQELANSVNKKHIRDVFYLWTAEENGLDYFLTVDKKFINAMCTTSRCKLTAKPISPISLLDILEVKVSDPLPLDDGNIHPYF